VSVSEEHTASYMQHASDQGDMTARVVDRYTREWGPFTMEAGDYYVGDLGYVMNRRAWKEFCNLTHPTGGGHSIDGLFELANGRKVITFSLPDGWYTDYKGRNYTVDSGTVGLTLVEGLKAEYEAENDDVDTKGEDFDSKMKSLGNIIEYKDKFACHSALDHGRELIRFGDSVTINTFDGVFDCSSDEEPDPYPISQDRKNLLSQWYAEHCIEKSGMSMPILTFNKAEAKPKSKKSKSKK
jgi:hypothetical protein